METLRFKRPTKLFEKRFHSSDASRCRVEFFRDSQIKCILDRFCRTGVLDQPNLNRPTVVGDEYPGDLSDSLAIATSQRENGGFNNDNVTEEEKTAKAQTGNEQSVKLEENHE